MSREKFYRGPSGRLFCYDSDPLSRCPMDQAGVPVGDRPARYAETVDVLDALGLDGARLLGAAHRSARGPMDGNLCACCGAEREKIGYRAWVYVPVALAESETTARVAGRLGFDFATERSQIFATKREAIQWAREEARIDEAIAEEARR